MGPGVVDGNSTATVAQSLAKRHAAAAITTPTTPSSGVGTTASQGISSNDFLTLLVTEMKNQDPTQPTDPNAYIQQLVGVNSLQQLISINQALTTAPTTATPPTTTTPTTTKTATGGVASSSGIAG